jgi:hypothetical protein
MKFAIPLFIPPGYQLVLQASLQAMGRHQTRAKTTSSFVNSLIKP